PEYVVVDPSAASFRAQLYHDGLSAMLGDNDVLAGIRTVASLLATGRLKVHRSCRGYIEEVAGDSWEAHAAPRGSEQPGKEHAHSLDAARYAIHSTRAVWQYLLAPPEPVAT